MVARVAQKLRRKANPTTPGRTAEPIFTPVVNALTSIQAPVSNVAKRSPSGSLTKTQTTLANCSRRAPLSNARLPQAARRPTRVRHSRTCSKNLSAGGYQHEEICIQDLHRRRSIRCRNCGCKHLSPREHADDQSYRCADRRNAVRQRLFSRKIERGYRDQYVSVFSARSTVSARAVRSIP